MTNSTQSLKELIERHDNLYYNDDNPEISDAEYDALKAQYEKLTGESVDTYVQGEASDSLPRIEHPHPIKSLSKVNSYDDLRKEMKRLAPFVIQMKMDGLTVVEYPNNGTRQYATRGNGTVGEDITRTATAIQGLSDTEPFDKPVRMEAFMKKSVFEELNKRREADGKPLFKNPRNAAAGMLRNKKAEKVHGLEYVAYNIVGSSAPDSEQIRTMKEHNYQTVDYLTHDGDMVYSAADIDNAIKQIEAFDRDQLDYEIDGLVIKSNKPDALRLFGSTGHHPKNMVAYKFPSTGAWTTLLGVTNQIGRTGKITPVAEIEPIDIMGSTISRVTLHNYGIMNALNVSIGCEVFVIKANDVIPAITKTRKYNADKKVEKPSDCPECASPLVDVNDQQFCQNPTCPSKRLFNLLHFSKRDALDIEGLSEETVKKMIAAGFIDTPYDVFTLTKAQLMQLPGFAERSATKLYNNIQKSRTTSLKQFIYAAGLPTVGRSVSDDLAQKFQTIDALIAEIDAGAKNIATIDGIGDTLLNNLKKHVHLLRALNEYVTPDAVVAKTVTVDKQLTFVVTGKFDQPRKYYEQLIKDAGHKVSGSVSKNTDYLLAGEKAGSKKAKAEKLNTPIIESENDLKLVIW